MNKWTIGGIIFLTILLSACGSGEDDLTVYIRQVKSRPPKPPIDPIPEFKWLPKFIYPENDQRRSPFQPVQIERNPNRFAPNTNRLRQPLEAFPLDALKFVGILKQDNTIWALISQPGGLITRVKVGDYMGQNYGQISKVKEKSIIIVESVKVLGQWERKNVVLDMQVPK